MSRIVKATYVRLDQEPMQLETPELVLPQIESEEEENEEELSESIKRRLERVQEIERHLEEQRQQATSELDELRMQTLKELEQLKRESEEELAVQREAALHKAQEEGYHDGFQRGREEGLAAVDMLKQQAQQMLRDAALESERRVAEGERTMLELTFALARKVIEKDLNEDSEAILQQIRQALRQFKQVPQVIIKVPQDRYPVVQAQLSELKEEFRQIGAIDCLADPGLPLTDVVIDSPFGMVDVRFDSQLEILHEALLQLLGERTS